MSGIFIVGGVARPATWTTSTEGSSPSIERPRLRRHSGDQSARIARRVSFFVREDVRERKRTSSHSPVRSSASARSVIELPKRLERTVQVQADAKTRWTHEPRARDRIALVHVGQSFVAQPAERFGARRHESDLLISVQQQQRAALAEVSETRRGPVAHPVVLVAAHLGTESPGTG